MRTSLRVLLQTTVTIKKPCPQSSLFLGTKPVYTRQKSKTLPGEVGEGVRKFGFEKRMFSVSSKVLSFSLLGKHRKKLGILRAERRDNFRNKNRFSKMAQVEQTLVKVKFLVVFLTSLSLTPMLMCVCTGWRGARGRA